MTAAQGETDIYSDYVCERDTGIGTGSAGCTVAGRTVAKMTTQTHTVATDVQLTGLTDYSTGSGTAWCERSIKGVNARLKREENHKP